MEIRYTRPICGRGATPALVGLTLLAVLAAPVIAEECSQPYVVEVPDEAPETTDDMLEIQKSVKDYLAEAEAYLACSETEMGALSARRAGVEDPDRLADMERELQSMLKRYNSTVDEMHAVGDRFNQLVALFKQRNSG